MSENATLLAGLRQIAAARDGAAARARAKSVRAQARRDGVTIPPELDYIADGVWATRGFGLGIAGAVDAAERAVERERAT